MLPWETLADATLPGGGSLRLKRRGGEFSIMLSANELMNSRLSGSEEAMARLTAERLAVRPAPTVLIGGLGMGFTLRAALAAFGEDARIEVAELVPEVVAWARGPLADILGGCLDDPRVTVRTGDVGQMIATAQARYDAILLDVDNGPQGLTMPENDALYGSQGLALSKRALTAGGLLAVWSQGPDAAFGKRLDRAGYAVEEIGARAGRGRGKRHVVWLARRP
jgi:spermidine synthase